MESFELKIWSQIYSIEINENLQTKFNEIYSIEEL